MPPAAPQTVRAVETASALYGSPAVPPSALALRDRTAAGSASSDEDEDDGWVPVPQHLVHTWRTVAITATALERGQSLDLATAGAAGGGQASLQAKMSTMRVVASCNNLQSLLAPPPVPNLLPLPPPTAPSSAASGSSSLRRVAQRAARPRRRLLRVPGRLCSLPARDGGALRLEVPGCAAVPSNAPLPLILEVVPYSSSGS